MSRLDRGAPGLRRLRRGRPAHRGGAAPALLGGAARRDREGPPGRVQRPAPGARRRPPHRRPGPHGRLHQRRADHDVEPAGRPGRASSGRSSSTGSTTSSGSGRWTGRTSPPSSTSSSRPCASAWPPASSRWRSRRRGSWPLADKGYDPVFGARPLKRLLQREIADRLALALLEGRFHEGDTITVDVDDDGRPCPERTRPAFGRREGNRGRCPPTSHRPAQPCVEAPATAP